VNLPNIINNPGIRVNGRILRRETEVAWKIAQVTQQAVRREMLD